MTIIIAVVFKDVINWSLLHLQTPQIFIENCQLQFNPPPTTPNSKTIAPVPVPQEDADESGSNRVRGGNRRARGARGGSGNRGGHVEMDTP